jgi:hypothetical protein
MTGGAVVEPQGEEIFLTSSGLARIHRLEPHTFTFILGENRYECSRSQAIFISGAVARILDSDITIDEFRFGGTWEDFEVIRGVFEDGRMFITDSNWESVMRIGRVLENEELLRSAERFWNSHHSISVLNVVRSVRAKNEAGLDIAKELEFIASHFYEINVDELRGLSVGILELVLNHANLQLIDEDSLVKFLLPLGEEYLSLYGYVHCEYLSVDGITDFLQKVTAETVNGKIWSSICKRLVYQIPKPAVRNSRYLFVYKEGGELSGILSA